MVIYILAEAAADVSNFSHKIIAKNSLIFSACGKVWRVAIDKALKFLIRWQLVRL
jgi:hypothetical protein